LLHHLSQIALFTINCFRPVRSVAGFKGVGTARGLALAFPELEGVSLFEALVMTAVRAQSWQGEVHPAVEGQLLGNDAEGLGALLVAPALVGAANYLF